MKVDCIKCGKQNGPNIPLYADYAGWICPKCMALMEHESEEVTDGHK